MKNRNIAKLISMHYIIDGKGHLFVGTFDELCYNMYISMYYEELSDESDGEVANYKQTIKYLEKKTKKELKKSGKLWDEDEYICEELSDENEKTKKEKKSGKLWDEDEYIDENEKTKKEKKSGKLWDEDEYICDDSIYSGPITRARSKALSEKNIKMQLLNENDTFLPNIETFLNKVFDKYDVDGDRFLSFDELDAFAVAANGEPFSEDSKEEIKTHFDVDERGYLTKDSFIQMFLLQSMSEPAETIKDLQTFGLLESC